MFLLRYVHFYDLMDTDAKMTAANEESSSRTVSQESAG
jgi:hypothetical protein